MTFTIKRLQKDIINMRISVYHAKRKNRERAMGAVGRHFKLNIKDRFLMLLLYYRLYITYTLAVGFLFDLDQNSNICRDIQKIESLVRQCLPIPQKLYKIAKMLKIPYEVEQYFPGFMAFINCTEQQIPRPSIDKERRKMYYSGKKKRYTVKNQLVVNNHGYIIHKATHKKGRRHDYIFEYTRITVLSLPNKVLMCLTLDILGRKRLSRTTIISTTA